MNSQIGSAEGQEPIIDIASSDSESDQQEDSLEILSRNLNKSKSSSPKNDSHRSEEQIQIPAENLQLTKEESQKPRLSVTNIEKVETSYEGLLSSSGVELSGPDEPTFRDKEGQPKKKGKKLAPYEIDLASRYDIDFEPEELSDDELDLEMDQFGNPIEVIFGELLQGSYFGAMALEQEGKDRKRIQEARGGRCLCSVWALQNCHILYIRKDDYAKWKDRFILEKQSDLHIYLRSIPIFKLLSLYYYRLIANKITEVHRERLTYLFQEGDKVEYIYIIQAGEFKVTKRQLISSD